MKISVGAPARLRRLIMEELKVGEDEVVEVDGLIGSGDLKEPGAGRAAGPSSGPRSRRAFPKGCREPRRATCSARSARRTCCCITPTRRSTWWCGFSSRPPATPDVVAIKPDALPDLELVAPILVDALCEAARGTASPSQRSWNSKARFDEAAKHPPVEKAKRNGRAWQCRLRLP